MKPTNYTTRRELDGNPPTAEEAADKAKALLGFDPRDVPPPPPPAPKKRELELGEMDPEIEALAEANRANKPYQLPPRLEPPLEPTESKARKQGNNTTKKLKSLQRKERLLKRVIKIKHAHDHLMTYTQLSMPDPEDPGDPDRSLYQPGVHHYAICEALEKVERGEIKRLIISMPPRHGKSELASRRFPAWFVGRDCRRQVIFCSYGQEFAEEFGREWRDQIRQPFFQQIFPGVGLRHDSATTARMQLTYEKQPTMGVLVATGAGGTITGRGADLFLIDDPVKNDEEANSLLLRNKLWNFYTKTAYHRLMPNGRCVIIMTRWHSDDLVGRLTDPSNDHYDPEEAATWTVLKLPALMGDRALWPERYPVSSLRDIKRTLRSRAFSALYQQEPTPDAGAYFSTEMLIPYSSPAELPKNLRTYGASDHALTTKQENDATVLGCFGIDEFDHIWIYPDLVWDRMETDRTLEEMMALMRRHKPLLWFAEDEHINRSLGPFRRRRMAEERIYTAVYGLKPTKDLRARARPIQGRMDMGMVHFPTFSRWYTAAENEILRFDRAPHDDFVSFLSLIGLGLDIEVAAENVTVRKEPRYETGTMAWLKASSDHEERRKRMAVAADGF